MLSHNACRVFCLQKQKDKFGVNGVSSDYAFMRQALQLVLGVPLLNLILFSQGRALNSGLYTVCMH